MALYILSRAVTTAASLMVQLFSLSHLAYTLGIAHFAACGLYILILGCVQIIEAIYFPTSLVLYLPPMSGVL